MARKVIFKYDLNCQVNDSTCWDILLPRRDTGNGRRAFSAWAPSSASRYFPLLCERTVKDLVRLRGCASTPGLSLFAYVVSTIFTWLGSIALEGRQREQTELSRFVFLTIIKFSLKEVTDDVIYYVWLLHQVKHIDERQYRQLLDLKLFVRFVFMGTIITFSEASISNKSY